MKKNHLYEELLNSESLGFIDPFTDLGEFDVVQMKFKESVHQLRNKYS
ncbi:modification methylase Sau96I, partial [Streptococcus vicugnae]